MSELPDVEAREIVCRVLESIAARGRSSDTLERHLELRDRVWADSTNLLSNRKHEIQNNDNSGRERSSRGQKSMAPIPSTN